MNHFEARLNELLVETFNNILKFEEMSIKSLSDDSITVTEAHLLEAVGKEGEEASVGTIAKSLGIAKSTATVAIKKLERKGYVRRETCAEDGRRTMISLTPLGAKLNRTHELFHEIMVRNISREFTQEEQDQLLKAVDKLSEFFKNKTEGRKE